MDRPLRQRKPTMEDVARRAGVSAATVARALYQKGYIRPATRKAVEQALSETGYRPSVVARGLRHRRSFTLGVIVRDARLNVLHAGVARAVEIEALRLGYSVLKLNNNRDIQIERAGVQQFLDHDVEAVIFCSANHPDSVRAFLARGIPAVQIERETALGSNLITVEPDQGIFEAIDHLHALGHRHFAFIGGISSGFVVEGPIEEAVEHRRERAFEARLRHHGIAMPASSMMRGLYYRENEEVPHPGYEMMRQAMHLEPRPTAILFGSDLLAAAALQAIHDAALSVPGDFSIVGYDNSMSEFLTPPLSSVAQPVEELGRAAVEMVLADISSGHLGTARKEMKTHLVLRGSTGPVPAALAAPTPIRSAG